MGNWVLMKAGILRRRAGGLVGEPVTGERCRDRKDVGGEGFAFGAAACADDRGDCTIGASATPAEK